MENINVKENQCVRLYAFPPKSVNADARVIKIYPNGDVWISNINMPFQGTISKIFSKEKFKNLTTP